MDEQKMESQTVGVVGPGRMGIGIATAILAGGPHHQVHLFDVKKREAGKEEEALLSAENEIQTNLRLLQELGLTSGSPDKALPSLSLERRLEESLPSCSLVFEALPEDISVKSGFYSQASSLLPKTTIIASTTSTFNLGVFKDLYSQPAQVLVAHWLNPAFLVPLVEVARAEWTHNQACDHLRKFLESVGKVPVTLKDSPGFIVPRIQVAAMNEAVKILEEGVADAEEIDTAVKAGFGFRLSVLGLLEFIDLGGLDTLARAGGYLHSTLGKEHYAPPASVTKKYGAGELGPKTGRGYFDYSGVDTNALFEERYRGFAALLQAFANSPRLSFRGGIHVDRTSGRRTDEETT